MKFSWKNIENWRSPENDFCLVFWFLVFGYWVVQKNFFFCFSVWKKSRRFIWGSIYSCTMNGFFRIFKKAVSELICTRLYSVWSAKEWMALLKFFLFQLVLSKKIQLFYKKMICQTLYDFTSYNAIIEYKWHEINLHYFLNLSISLLLSYFYYL